MGHGREDEQPESMTSDNQRINTVNPNATAWNKTPGSAQGKLLEKASSKACQTLDPGPAATQSTKSEAPSKRWWIEDAQVLAGDHPDHLCERCRHIDFNYLVHSPFEQISEEVTLGPLKWVFANNNCRFCRLLTSTMLDAAGGRVISTQVNGQDVKCIMRTIPNGYDNGSVAPSSKVSVTLDPAPDELDTFSDLLFQICQPRDDRPAGDVAKYGCCVQSPRIDYEQTNNWYQHCLYGECGSSPIPVPLASLPEGFRLIDVYGNCIIRYELQYRYIALSYVWGGIETLRNTKSINPRLEVVGALLERIYHLPGTIKDAMLLVKKLGERYLWVDSLCIVQDDENDRRTQIPAMNQIYSSAALTIVAASGDNADSGLAGMSGDARKFKQHTEKVRDVYLTNCTRDFVQAVDDSVWNTRAWTLQERIMSPRVLFVAKDRCYFACKHCQNVVTESTDNPEESLLRKNKLDVFEDSTANMIPSLQHVNIISYRRVVESYTSRHLTYGSDMLNAFRGIEAVFRPLFRSDFLFGLPRSELDSQLLWQPVGPCTRRCDPATNLPMFPSWSWAGWVGKVTCNTREDLSRIAWIEGKDQTRFSGNDFRYPKAAVKDAFKRLSYRMQWRCALKNDVPYYTESSDPERYFFHPTANEEERTLGPNPKAGTDHLVFEAEISEALGIGLDHFWTHSLWRQECTQDKHTVCPLTIRDEDNHIGGYVMVPGEIATRLNNDDAATYDFVRISRTKTLEQKNRGKDNPEMLDDKEAVTLEKSYFPDRQDVRTPNGNGICDAQRFDLTKPWCLYTVMLVEWKDEVAFRLGVGSVHIDAWAQARPKKQIIVLG